MTRTAAAPAPVARADTDAFAELIEQRFGHQPEEHRMIDLAALLQARLARTGSTGWAEYRELLAQSGRSLKEWEELAPLLTVPETYFFRLPDHFEALAGDALPRLLEARAASRSLRLLSAGCATGEEAYTLRILLNERFPQLAQWRVEIVGVDLSPQALERARLGLYSAWSLRATSPARQQANFTAAGKQFRLRPEARAGVEFRRENLLAPPPPGEPAFDVIFCRNVLIYFSPAAMREAIARLTERLAPGGFLFLGPAESLRGLSGDFELFQTHNTFFYRRKTAPGEQPGTPGRASAPAAPSPMPDQNVPWFASIQSSSERLAALVTPAPPAPAKPATPATSVSKRPPGTVASPRPHTGPAAGLPGFAALLQAERFAEALALLDAAPPAAPGADEQRVLLRASMLTNLGRYPEAEAECRGLVARDERNAAAHYLLGLCREQAGAVDEADGHMTRSTDLDPGFAMAHLHRGLLARRRRLPAEASLRLALEAIAAEDPERLALFGGGFSREGLRSLCLRELARPGAA